MKTFSKLADAREFLEHNGGWLLTLGPSDGSVDDEPYGVTDDEALVVDLRGQSFVDRCEAIQCWDETQGK